MPDWDREFYDALGACPALSNGGLHDLWCPVPPGSTSWQAWECFYCHGWVRMGSKEWEAYDVARELRRASARRRRQPKDQA